MSQQFPDLPTTPMPALKSPRSRPRRRFWLLALCIVAVLVVVGVVLALVVPSHTQARGTTSGPGNVVTATASAGNNQTTGVVISTATPAATATTSRSTPPGAVATPTPHPGQPGITHGRPQLGGPLTDFIGKYGTPSNQGDTSGLNFWTGTDQTIDLNVNGNEQGKAEQVTVLGADNWTTSQTQTYCEQFLPTGAAQTSSSATLITYSSHAGTVDLKLLSASSCSLSFARA